jgi:uncharacterized FlaG/YvyC family protein
MVEEIGSISPVEAAGSGDPGSTATLPASAAVRPLNPPRAPSQSAPRAVHPSAQPSAQQLQADLKRANAQLSSVNREIELQVDRATGLTIVKVKNSQTGEVVQQFPSDNSLHLAQLLAAWSSGKNALVDLIA